MPAPAFSPIELLRLLQEHGVRFVVIGGLAATIHGSPYPTYDVDITPQASRENLARLSNALRALEARIRVQGITGGIAFEHDADSLLAMRTVNLVTRLGDLDLALEPAGVGGFAAWDAGATDLEVEGVGVRLASLDDVIRSKEAADREKDRATLPILRELRRRMSR